jgi:multimeric flavodoxin WrbA
MIKIIGISGSPIKKGNVERCLEEALNFIKEESDVSVEIITLSEKEIRGCIHCNWCVKNQTDGKFCFQQDDMSVIYPKILEADGLILASPVHFGRLSGLLANMIDRLRVFVHGNVYRGRLQNKVGGSMAVAFFRGGGIETTLASINTLFLTLKMIIANSVGYQAGAGILTSLEGKGKIQKGVSHMALEDDFGMNSAKSLARRVLELAEMIKLGQERLSESTK